MKVLYLTSWSPYPCLAGVRRRTHQTLQSLRSAFEVRHISFATGTLEKDLLEAQGSIAVPYSYDTRSPSHPPSLWPFNSPQFQSEFQKLKPDSFDITLFDQLFTTTQFEQAPGKRVLMEHNVESELLRQQAQHLDPSKKRLGLVQFMALKAYENRLWPQCDLRLAVSEKDAAEIRARCPSGPTVVSPNGVDLDRAKLLDLSGEPRLLYVGALDYPPNQDAVEQLLQEIMPKIWEELPDMKLRVLGRNPSEELRAAIDKDSRLELFASPPELEPLAQDCSISVVPLRMGSGTRLKILEACAWGMPVVTSSVGCEGLQDSLTRHLRVADGAEAFAQAVIEMWRHPEERAEQARLARPIVEQTYSWDATLQPLVKALRELVPE